MGNFCYQAYPLHIFHFPIMFQKCSSLAFTYTSFPSQQCRVWVFGPTLKSRGRMCSPKVPSSPTLGWRFLFGTAPHSRTHWLASAVHEEHGQVGLLAVEPGHALPQSGVLNARGFREGPFLFRRGPFNTFQVHVPVVFVRTFVFVHHTMV